MPKSYIERIKEAGVVGAGGAGFPTHIKVANQAEIIIANGVECEPLLKTDQKLMENYADKLVEGLYLLLNITGAERGVVCIKEKYHSVQESLLKAIGKKQKVEIFLVGNYYPAGDEQQLVYEVTNRVIPTGGLPLDVGVIVNNVNTIINVYDAINNELPVTNRYVTITGEVNSPAVINAPVGTPICKLIERAGGLKGTQQYRVIIGGPAMGKVENDLTIPITKTTNGVIVLKADHPLIVKKTLSLKTSYKMAKSVCCQCSLCSQLCPRNALGLNLKPHKIMRAVGYSMAEAIDDINSVFSCCDCGVCTYYACDMGLSPNRIVTEVKNSLLKKGCKPEKDLHDEVSVYRDYQKVPTNRFTHRLGLSDYDHDIPLQQDEAEVDYVKILLKQHIGVPASSVVFKDDLVSKGDIIAEVNENDLGAYIHASISGVITKVTEDYIEIKKNG